MAFGHISLGIDLSEDKIVISQLKKSYNTVWVTSNQVIPLTPDKSKEERDLEIINAIQRFVANQNSSKENVFVALPREKTLMKLLEVPSAVEENLRKALEYELAKHVPFSPEEAAFDFQILEKTEGLLRVLLVVIKKDIVNEYLDLFRRMGIRPVAIEISSTASANLFYYDQNPVGQPSFALIDIRKHFFEFHFFEQGSLTETVQCPFFNENQKAKEVTEAYRLSLLKGLGPKDGKQNLFAYGEEVDDPLINDLKEWLSFDITSAPALKKIRTANGLQRIPVSYPSIGLALRGLLKTKWNINLLPVNLRKKVSHIGVYLAVFFCMVSLVLGAALVVRPFLQEREELNRVLAEVKATKPKMDAIEAIQKKREMLEKEVREFETLISEGTSRLNILKELSEILPSTVWIWNMKLKSKDLEINGFANSASDLIAILDKSSLFEKVEFSSPVTKERRLFGDQTEKERFRISAKIERVK